MNDFIKKFDLEPSVYRRTYNLFYLGFFVGEIQSPYLLIKYPVLFKKFSAYGVYEDVLIYSSDLGITQNDQYRFFDKIKITSIYGVLIASCDKFLDYGLSYEWTEKNGIKNTKYYLSITDFKELTLFDGDENE